MSKGNQARTSLIWGRETIPGLIKIINPMNYMLLIAETQADFDRRGDPARGATLGEAWKAYSDALRRASVFVRGSGLHPP
jgi:hypothetical protein